MKRKNAYSNVFISNNNSKFKTKLNLLDTRQLDKNPTQKQKTSKISHKNSFFIILKAELILVQLRL